MVAALTGSAATVITARILSRTGQDRRPGWVRANFRQRQVSLAGGVAAAAGATAAAATLPGRRTRSGAMLAVSGAAAFGLIDDLSTNPAGARGLRGHLRALRQGRVTTGAIKLAGIPAVAIAAASCLTGSGAREQQVPAGARCLDLLASGALIAGTANLINLFDLRPGRALKVCAAPAAALTATGTAAAGLGAGATGVLAAAWPADLAERTMLGDTGANALGALLGTGFVLVPSTAVRTAALGGIVTLIALSEKVSFSAVIDGSPALARIDAWGRRQ